MLIIDDELLVSLRFGRMAEAAAKCFEDVMFWGEGQSLPSREIIKIVQLGKERKGQFDLCVCVRIERW